MYVLPDKWQVSRRDNVVVAKSVYVLFEFLSEKLFHMAKRIH